jgi:hypothetical protein
VRVGGSCRSWVVVPILCGEWSWFMGWTSHVIIGVVRGQLYSLRVVVGDGCGSSSFVDFDRGQFVGGHARFVLWWVVIVCG